MVVCIASAWMAGCTSVGHRITGQYYLETRNYRDGIEAFEPVARQASGDWSIYYYLGRFYLSEDQPEDALRALTAASLLNPENADTQFWLGVTHYRLDRADLERRSYLKALKIDNRHLFARAYLAHNLLEQKNYSEALKHYQIVLSRDPDHSDALYNRALILGKLDRTPEEIIAWKAYLARCPSGARSRLAVDRLNRLGDFAYRNVLVGKRTVTLETIHFLPFDDDLAVQSRPSLDLLGAMLENNRKIVLNALVFQKNNVSLAEARAKRIKKYLLIHFPGIRPDRIRVSWFKEPETIRISKRTVHRQDESVRFFTQWL